MPKVAPKEAQKVSAREADDATICGDEIPELQRKKSFRVLIGHAIFLLDNNLEEHIFDKLRIMQKRGSSRRVTRAPSPACHNCSVPHDHGAHAVVEGYFELGGTTSRPYEWVAWSANPIVMLVFRGHVDRVDKKDKLQVDTAIKRTKSDFGIHRREPICLEQTVPIWGSSTRRSTQWSRTRVTKTNGRGRCGQERTSCDGSCSSIHFP